MLIEDGTGKGKFAGVDTDNRLEVSSIATPLEHHELHESELFTCHYENTVTNTDEMTVVAFNTPKTRDVVLAFRAEVTGTATIAFCENTSIDAGEGTTLTVYNRNRGNKVASEMRTIEATPVEGSVTRFDETQAAGANITTTTELWQQSIGSDLKQAVESRSGRSMNEWLLEKNQQYAVVIKSTTDDDNICNLTLNWYEEEIAEHGHEH